MNGKIHVILLAAGNSIRFGNNKLLHKIDGKPLYQFLPDTLKEVQSCDGVHCIVSQYKEILEQMAERGYHCVKNDKPEDGIAHSIRLGIEYLEEIGVLMKEDAILFGVCDSLMCWRKRSKDCWNLTGKVKRDWDVSAKTEDLGIRLYLERLMRMN